MANKTKKSISDRRIDNIKACERVDSRLLRQESLIMGSKYADYAFIGPVEATKLFRSIYTEIYQEYHGKYVDRFTADKKLGVKRADFFENDSATINSLWKARQKADAFGIPYDLYIRWAFERLHKNGYKRLPRPNQLYSEKLVKHLEISWSRRVKNQHFSFPLTKDPRFKNENFKLEPAQFTYRKLLMKRSKTYGVSELPAPLAFICFTAEQLEPKVINDVFELDYDFVKGKVRKKDYAYDGEVDASDYRRPCYGLPHVKEVVECKTCPLRGGCKEERQAVEKTVLSRHGQLDISGEKRRAQQRERKRRQRQREKEKQKLSAAV